MLRGQLAAEVGVEAGTGAHGGEESLQALSRAGRDEGRWEDASRGRGSSRMGGGYMLCMRALMDAPAIPLHLHTPNLPPSCLCTFTRPALPHPSTRPVTSLTMLSSSATLIRKDMYFEVDGIG